MHRELPAAAHRPPSPDEVLRAEVEMLRAELEATRLDAALWRDEADHQRARRESTVDLAAVHVRSFIAFVEHVQRELKQDAEETKAQQR